MEKSKKNKIIYSTIPFLPPQKEYQDMISGIWKRNYLTNNGPLVRELEKKLKEYLKSPDLIFTSSGTIALQLAIKALGIKKEVVTTPFSFVATTSSIVWENCTPVFVDIDPSSLNIDVSKIEKSITKNTEAILATHCFGNPCDVEEIRKIAKKHNLKVIYDAAHCFGVKYKGKSIFDWGDISIISFHATKIFHTVEGGGLFTKNKKLLEKIKLMRNFGQENSETYKILGINGKNSEFHAAMGLCNLKYADEILKKRKRQFKIYDSLLKDFPVERQLIRENTNYNYSYYPLIFKSEEILLAVKEELERNNIFTRRYFYPSLSKLSYLEKRQKMPITEDIAKRILCLPIYDTIKKVDQELIVEIIRKYEKN